MDKLDELEKLAKLKDKGILTEAEFKKAKEKVLSSSEAITKMTPPPQKAKPAVQVTDGFVWAGIIGMIILSIVLNPLLEDEDSVGAYMMIFFLFNSFIYFCDEQQVRKACKTPPNMWYLFLVPVYLWKRCTIVGDTNRVLFWAWMVCWLVTSFAF